MLPYVRLVILLLLPTAACKQGVQDVDQQNALLTQCQHELSACQVARQEYTALTAERDELKAALESVTRELVEVKVDRDKMVVELRAYRRHHSIDDNQE